MLTYGEAWFEAKMKTYQDGNKLEYVTTLPKKLRLKAVQYLMYGHPNKGILNAK